MPKPPAAVRSRRRRVGRSVPDPAYDPEQIRRALGYVPSVARHFLGGGLDYQELIAAGNLGLVQAALRFDASRGVLFATYADWWIRKAIIEALIEQSGALRVPRHHYEKLRRLERARAAFRSRFGAEPTTAELSLASGLAEAEVERLGRSRHRVVSLDQPASPGGDPLGETLSDPGAESPQRGLVRRQLARLLRRRLSSLPPREAAVLALRFGLRDEPPRTLRDVGRALGISRERVRQIELRALLKLRRLLPRLGV